jgi:hypothetical protein
VLSEPDCRIPETQSSGQLGQQAQMQMQVRAHANLLRHLAVRVHLPLAGAVLVYVLVVADLPLVVMVAVAAAVQAQLRGAVKAHRPPAVQVKPPVVTVQVHQQEATFQCHSVLHRAQQQTLPTASARDAAIAPQADVSAQLPRPTASVLIAARLP